MIYIYSTYHQTIDNLCKELLAQGFNLTISDDLKELSLLTQKNNEEFDFYLFSEKDKKSLLKIEEQLKKRQILTQSATSEALKPLLSNNLIIALKTSIILINKNYFSDRTFVKKNKNEQGKIYSIKTHFQTLEEAKTLAFQISQYCESHSQIELGLSEILINAIEHGNLEISYDKKTELKGKDCWHKYIKESLQKSPYKERFVSLSFKRLTGKIEIVVKDCGPGFDWRNYNSNNEKRLLDYHGRGLLLAQSLSFDNITFNEQGNEVTCSISLNEQ